MTTGCKVYPTEHAEALYRAQTAPARLTLVTTTIYWEAYVSDVNKWDATTWTWRIQSMITEGFDRWQWRQLISMPSYESKHSTTLMILTMIYAEIYELRVWMVGAVWVPKWRCRWYESSSDIPSVAFITSLLCCSSLLGISARYKWLQHRFLPSANEGAVSQCSGSTERSPSCFTGQLWDLWIFTIVCIGWLSDALFLFPSLLLNWLWQTRRSAPKERDNASVTCDWRPGNHQSTEVAAAALRSVPNTILFNLPLRSRESKFAIIYYLFPFIGMLGHICLYISL